jgi:hypothetical protein
VAGAGVRRCATGQCRARRPWELAGMCDLALLIGHAHAGMLDRTEVRQKDVGGGSRWFSSFLPCLTARARAGETGDRQQGERGSQWVLLRALGRMREQSATVVGFSRFSAHKVFDAMPARNLNSNF